MLDSILEKVGLKYEDLNKAEQDTINGWLDNLKKNQLTIEKIRDYISSMRHSVEMELSTHKLGSKQDQFLKARLRNYLLLEALLISPEKVKAQMEAMLSGIVKR